VGSSPTSLSRKKKADTRRRAAVSTAPAGDDRDVGNQDVGEYRGLLRRRRRYRNKSTRRFGGGSDGEEGGGGAGGGIGGIRAHGASERAGFLGVSQTEKRARRALTCERLGAGQSTAASKAAASTSPARRRGMATVRGVIVVGVVVERRGRSGARAEKWMV